jgi:glyoxylase-like metal-dependent hydrolase (beta-lactamase superfamily II)
MLFALLLAAVLAPDLQVTPIAEGAYVARHTSPWISNSLVLRMKTGDVLLVDTPVTPAATERLLEWVDQTLKPTRMVAVNTHYHIDRLGGNAVLRRRGIRVYGSDHTVRLLKQRGEEMRRLTIGWVSDAGQKKAYAEVPLVAPNAVFAESAGKRLVFGGDSVEIVFPGAGHTPDNLVVYDRSRGILFGGCFLVGGERLGNLTEADPVSWVRALSTLRRWEVRLAIGAHSDGVPPFDPAIIDHTRRLLVNHIDEQAHQAPR